LDGRWVVIPPENTPGPFMACWKSAEDFCGEPQPTWQEAVRAFCKEEMVDHPDTEVEVWNVRPPQSPAIPFGHYALTNLVDAADLTEDYMIDAASDYLRKVTPEQSADLEKVVTAAVEGWLERHNLKPDWWVGVERWNVTLGQAEKGGGL